MAYHLDDTIAAIATAAGGAARGMVRVSGPDALRIADACFVTDRAQLMELIRYPAVVPGNARVRIGACDAQIVPADLFVWPTNRSYTREPVVEIHTLGSPVLLENVLAAVCCAGARLAEPGEFTLRAFLAGRLDLTQAEAVLGVIDAHSRDQLTTALAQLAGGLARPLDQLRNELLQMLVELEAGLDFVDEDIEFVTRDELLGHLKGSRVLLDEVERQMAARLSTASANQVVLLGEPNAGKSSLFNALVARFAVRHVTPQRMTPQAIVSPMRGTTRDYLTAILDLDGLRCELIDTAGLENRQTELATAAPENDWIDVTAQAHSRSQSQRAVIRVWCVDVSSRDAKFSKAYDSKGCELIVGAKADLAEPEQGTRMPTFADAAPIVLTSSVTGEGLNELCGRLRERLSSDATAAGRTVAATADRCSESIRLATGAISRATDLVESGGGEELVAVEVRVALDELGKVVGRVYTEDVLDRIFKTFCIGK